ncbi:MAG: hypothetical protein IKF19_04830 [Bacilli bacterium]|nr:hypothetical protein [Bacilli bacterium]
MKYTNFLEKMSYLFKMICSSSIYPIFLMVMTLLTIILISKKIKNNKVIVMMIISYLVMYVITIYNHPRTLGRVFDSIATNLFSNIYFPSTQVYLFTLLVIDIITITSMLNKNKDKNYKIANGICFFVTKFLLILILDVVGKKKIDVFSKKSLFSNTNLIVLLELSIGVFVIWLLSLVVIYITNVVVGRIADKAEDSNRLENEYLSSVNLEDNYVYETNHELEPEVQENPVEEAIYAVENNNVIDEKPLSTVTEAMSIQDNLDVESSIYDTTEKDVKDEAVYTVDDDNFSLEDLVISITEDDLDKENNIIEPQVDSNILFDRLINNGIPLIKEEKNDVIDEKNTYTLNDYKTFNKMLKEIREMSNTNIINIDSRLDLRLKLRYSEDEYNLFKSMIKSYSN